MDKFCIVADFGKSYLIADQIGNVFEAHTRGKKIHYACGDWVRAIQLNDRQAVIEELLPRDNFLCRTDHYHNKIIATNIQQILFVIASWPRPDFYLLQRAIIAAEASCIPLMVLQNKKDLEGSKELTKKLSFFQKLGYLHLSLTALDDTEPLEKYLIGQTSLLIGQSGVGKTTIINGLLREQVGKVQDISTHWQTGKHTTSHTVRYQLAQGQKKMAVIDSPGLRQFGLYHISPSRLAFLFPDFRNYLGHCRFRNCLHLHEPGCAIRQALVLHQIREDRFTLLQTIAQENLKYISFKNTAGAADGTRTRDLRRDRPIL